MVQKQEFSSREVLSGALKTQILHGAGIAFLIIGIYLLGVKSNPVWSQYWMLRPLIIVPIAGAMGGVFYHVMGNLRSQEGWVKAVGILLNFIGYLVIVWLGIVLGLDGTLWD